MFVSFRDSYTYIYISFFHHVFSPYTDTGNRFSFQNPCEQVYFDAI